MAGSPGRFNHLANALAFVVTIVIGITVGYALTTREHIEDKFRSRKP
jgi:hypothetical protein